MLANERDESFARAVVEDATRRSLAEDRAATQIRWETLFDAVESVGITAIGGRPLVEIRQLGGHPPAITRRVRNRPNWVPDWMWDAVEAGSSGSAVETNAVEAEREHRSRLWLSLQKEGGHTQVAPGRLRSLGIYGGAQGVWVDKARTQTLTEDGVGVTVSLLHTGSAYADDLSELALVYHYPRTGRGGRRDASEVDATKATRALGLPVFVITYPTPGSGVREVRLGWVTSWDDDSSTFLIRFGDNPTDAPAVDDEDRVDEEESFVLIAPGDKRRRISLARRAGQPIFKFKCLKRYGARCAVCDVAFDAGLDAAHIRGVRDGGSDDPRNGLILCATHHRALDAHLFTIDPATLEIDGRPGYSRDVLRVTRPSLAHLERKPHTDALAWRQDKFIKSLPPDAMAR